MRRSSDPQSASSIPSPDYTVDITGGGTHTSLSAAIAASSTSNGAYQIIAVAPGVYPASSNLIALPTSKPKFLIIGLQGAGNTVIDGGGNTWADTIANSAVIASLTFRNWYQPLVVNAAGQEVRMVDLVVRDNTNTTPWPAAIDIQNVGKLVLASSSFINNSGGSSYRQMKIDTGSVVLLNVTAARRGVMARRQRLTHALGRGQRTFSSTWAALSEAAEGR